MITTIGPAPVRAPSLLPVSPGTWRVLDPSGRALGHIRIDPAAEGDRYLALRFHAASRAFRTIGAFWSRADAVDSLVFGR